MDLRQIDWLLGVLLLSSGPGCAQNLVRNGSFEDAARCPSSLFDFNTVAGWRIFRGTPDYFAACAKTPSLGMPMNYEGTRSTFFGQAYAGFAVVSVSPYSKGTAPDKSYQISEAIYTQTTRPLRQGKEYELTFWVSLSDSSVFSTPRLYCSFSEEAPVPGKNLKRFVGLWYQFDHSDAYPCNIDFAVKGLWNQVTVRFTAQRNYRYFAIGLPRSQYPKAQYLLDVQNPRRLSHTNKWDERSAYYYVDNVSLVEL